MAKSSLGRGSMEGINCEEAAEKVDEGRFPGEMEAVGEGRWLGDHKNERLLLSSLVVPGPVVILLRIIVEGIEVVVFWRGSRCGLVIILIVIIIIFERNVVVVVVEAKMMILLLLFFLDDVGDAVIDVPGPAEEEVIFKASLGK